MNWITGNWNGWIALLLYWLPLVLCAYGYTVRAICGVRKDRTNREKYDLYIPTITVGTLIGYAVLAVCPIANLFAAVFDVAPKLFSGFISWCGRVFDIPLVPGRKQGDS